MKKQYMMPALKVDLAQAENMLCVSFKSDDSSGLADGGGSDGDAHAPENDWSIWGDE